jgi:hypothetical protein
MTLFMNALFFRIKSLSVKSKSSSKKLSRESTPDCYLVDRQTTECGHTLEVIMKNMKPCFDQKLLEVKNFNKRENGINNQTIVQVHFDHIR